MVIVYLFFYKQKSAHEMRISDCSSGVCSSYLDVRLVPHGDRLALAAPARHRHVADLARRGDHRFEVARWHPAAPLAARDGHAVDAQRRRVGAVAEFEVDPRG